MFEGTRRWFRRNRTAFAVSLGAVGAIYLAGQYAWGKWLEVQQRVSEERIAKENLRRRFEQNQEDCTFTVLALLPTVRDEVLGAYPVEDISNELQQQRAERLARSTGGLSEIASADLQSVAPSTVGDSGSLNESYIHTSQMADSATAGATGQLQPRKSKAQLWGQMKIQSITRSLTLLYTVSLLTLLTRIQLNLLGRRTYLSSVVTLASPPAEQHAATISMENNDDDNYDNVYGSDFDTNRKYLTFSWWLLRQGTKKIAAEVEAAVDAVFGPINPREDVSLDRLAELVLDVRKRVEGATELDRAAHRWLPYLLPPPAQEEQVLSTPGLAASDSPRPDDAASAGSIDAALRRLLDETADFIDSPVFGHVATQLLNAAFAQLIHARVATEAFKLDLAAPPLVPPSTISTTTTDNNSSGSAKVKLASTLAVFCRQGHVIAAGSGDAADYDAENARPANEYLAAINAVGDLEAFAAVVYSSNFEFERGRAAAPVAGGGFEDVWRGVQGGAS